MAWSEGSKKVRSMFTWRFTAAPKEPMKSTAFFGGAPKQDFCLVFVSYLLGKVSMPSLPITVMPGKEATRRCRSDLFYIYTFQTNADETSLIRVSLSSHGTLHSTLLCAALADIPFGSKW